MVTKWYKQDPLFQVSAWCNSDELNRSPYRGLMINEYRNENKNRL